MYLTLPNLPVTAMNILLEPITLGNTEFKTQTLFQGFTKNSFIFFGSTIFRQNISIRPPKVRSYKAVKD